MTTTQRTSPIAHVLAEAPKGIEATLAHPTDLVKIGVKGPGVSAWAQQSGIDLPAKLYDVTKVGEQGSLARVGGEEIILECAASDALLTKIEESLRNPPAGVYRLEQQSATFDLFGDKALAVLAQTCGVDPTTQPPDKIFYTRIAGVSCGIIVREDDGARVYRIWVDYTLAPYLWENLVEIAGG